MRMKATARQWRNAVGEVRWQPAIVGLGPAEYCWEYEDSSGFFNVAWQNSRPVPDGRARLYKRVGAAERDAKIEIARRIELARRQDNATMMRFHPAEDL